MCSACGQMFSKIHWSDTAKTDSGGFIDTGAALRSRYNKVNYTNKILCYYGFKAAMRPGGGYIVYDKKGRGEICTDFGEIWPKILKISGVKVDPLDPGLIEYLNS